MNTRAMRRLFLFSLFLCQLKEMPVNCVYLETKKTAWYSCTVHTIHYNYTIVILTKFTPKSYLLNKAWFVQLREHEKSSRVFRFLNFHVFDMESGRRWNWIFADEIKMTSFEHRVMRICRTSAIFLTTYFTIESILNQKQWFARKQFMIIWRYGRVISFPLVLFASSNLKCHLQHKTIDPLLGFSNYTRWPAHATWNMKNVLFFSENSQLVSLLFIDYNCNGSELVAFLCMCECEKWNRMKDVLRENEK